MRDENRHDKLMEARAAALAGRSPREVGRDKVAAALDWVYRWGWSAASVLDEIGDSKRRGLAARMTKSGLLVATKTQAGGAVRGVPVHMLTLSGLGLAEAERMRETLLPYRLDPARVYQGQLRHDGLTQVATLRALNAGRITEFRTPVEFAEASKPNQKQPDAVWRLASGQRLAVEVELTAKWGRQLDQFVLGCVQSFGEKAANRVDQIAIVSDSPAILRRYGAALAAGATVGIWKKEGSVWKRKELKKIPDWMSGKVICQLIDA